MAKWHELVPVLSDEDRTQVEDGLAAAGARIVATIGAPNTMTFADDLTAHELNVLMIWPADELRRAALAVHGSWRGMLAASLLRKIGGRELPWTRADLVWALTVAANVFSYSQEMSHLELPAAIASQLDRESLAGLEGVLRAVVDHVQTDYFVSADSRRSVTTLIGRALDTITGAQIPSSLLHDGDHFGPLIRAEMAAELGAPGVAALLLHCSTLNKPAPPAKWLKVARELGAGQTIAADLLRRFADRRRSLHDDTDRLLRGLVWVVSDDDSEQTTELLAGALTAACGAHARSLGYPYAPRTAIAAVIALSTRGGDVPLTTFARLSLTVRNKALLSRLHTALEQAGALRGWSLAEVMELAVDDHGLDSEGMLNTTIDGYDATITLTLDKAALSVARDGKPLKSIPDAVKPLRDTVKEIGKTLALERQRVESLLSDEREWAYQDWVARYLEHPVTGRLGRALIWESTVAGLPHHDGARWVLATLDGSQVTVDRVRLWHPSRANVDDVRAWRDHLMATGLRQPFKQAFREVYLLTPAEQRTNVYSNRFAGHILRYRQANALMRVRGWQAGYLGTWDGGYNGEATKVFGGDRWRASFYHDLVENTDRRDYEARYCSTDQVRFAVRDGAAWAAVPVERVPPLVFSEAMRDVDLFVGVTSIAADPQWNDRGEDRFHDYWQQTSFGDLTASAEIRRDALERLLPRTKIADKVTLADRFLRVQGSLRAYKIHLGSGNILMEPNDKYLCIVAGRQKGGTLHLPFDEDVMLSMILSKAFLLASDHTITDETILQQIN